MKNHIVKVDLSKRISNSTGRLLRLAVRGSSTDHVLELGTETRVASNQADPNATGSCPPVDCDGLT